VASSIGGGNWSTQKKPTTYWQTLSHNVVWVHLAM